MLIICVILCLIDVVFDGLVWFVGLVTCCLTLRFLGLFTFLLFSLDLCYFGVCLIVFG